MNIGGCYKLDSTFSLWHTLDCNTSYIKSYESVASLCVRTLDQMLNFLCVSNPRQSLMYNKNAFYLSENEPMKGPNNKPNMGLATQIHDVPLTSSTMVP